MQKIRVRRHIKTNRLFIDLRGTLTEEDLLQLKDKLKRGLKKMKPPFGAVVNQSNLLPIKDALKNHVADVMSMTEKSGCKKVVRVIGNNVLVQMQTKQAQKNENSKVAYDIDFVDSIDKATVILDDLGL